MNELDATTTFARIEQLFVWSGLPAANATGIRFFKVSFFASIGIVGRVVHEVGKRSCGCSIAGTGAGAQAGEIHVVWKSSKLIDDPVVFSHGGQMSLFVVPQEAVVYLRSTGEGEGGDGGNLSLDVTSDGMLITRRFWYEMKHSTHRSQTRVNGGKLVDGEL